MGVDVTYNGKDLPNVYGPFNFVNNYNQMSFRCNFVVKGSSKSDLVNKCDEIEEKVREPYEAFSVDFGGSNEHSFSHDLNTYFLPDAKVSVVQDEKNTATTRHYQFEINAQLPADKDGFGFRRDAHFDIFLDASRRTTVKFSFVYTASPAPNAASSIENFNTNAIIFADTIISSLPGTYELVHQSSKTEHEEKITHGILVFQEILNAETEDEFDLSELVDVRASYTMSFMQAIGTTISETIFSSEGNLSSIPLVKVSISYTAKLNSDIISSDDELESVYRDKVKPFIIKRSFDVLGQKNFPNAGSTYIVESDLHNYDPTDFSIYGKLSFLAPRTLTDIIHLSEVLRIRRHEGRSYVKLWDQEDNSYSRWTRGSEETVLRTITITRIGAPVEQIPELDRLDADQVLEIEDKSARIFRKILGAGTELTTNQEKIARIEAFTTIQDERYRVVRVTFP